MAPARKTYWHLGANHRLPSDYEIATSRLLYHVDRGGFAVELPTSKFYARHQAGSPLVSDRWEEFADPRATTYTTYVGMARDRENYVGQLLASIDGSGYDAALPGDWIDDLGTVLSPLRFLFHGLQIVAAYVGQMAPSGRITVAALFQAADELRRVERVAQRIAQLRRLRPRIAEEGRTRWQSDPAWQPWRRAIEKLLCTYDWGEALVALTACCKPIVDELAMVELAALADRRGDYVDGQILRALSEDCRWHRAWSESLLALAFEHRSENREVVGRWLDAWTPIVDEAVSASGAMFGVGPGVGASRGNDCALSLLRPADPNLRRSHA